MRDIDAAKAALAGHYELVAGSNGALLIQRLGRHSRPSDDSCCGGRGCDPGEAHLDFRVRCLEIVYSAVSKVTQSARGHECCYILLEMEVNAKVDLR